LSEKTKGEELGGRWKKVVGGTEGENTKKNGTHGGNTVTRVRKEGDTHGRKKTGGVTNGPKKKYVVNGKG